MSSSKTLETEELISWSLRIGVYLAGTIIVLGLVLLFLTGRSGYPAGTFPSTVREALSGSLSLKPAAIISLGLMLLILTPVFRVAASIILFLREKDYLYSLITVVVLAILLVGLFFGKAI